MQHFFLFLSILICFFFHFHSAACDPLAGSPVRCELVRREKDALKMVINERLRKRAFGRARRAQDVRADTESHSCTAGRIEYHKAFLGMLATCSPPMPSALGAVARVRGAACRKAAIASLSRGVFRSLPFRRFHFAHSILLLRLQLMNYDERKPFAAPSFSLSLSLPVRESPEQTETESSAGACKQRDRT